MTATTTATRAVTVRAGGRALADDATARLTSVRVAARLGQPTQAELTFATAPVAFDAPARCRVGASLEISVHGHDDALFTGEVTAIEFDYAADGGTTFRVRAYDLTHRLRKRQETRVFESVTAAELADQLAGPVGLRVDAEADGPRIERLIQHRHTDYDLLIEVCGRAGLYPIADDDTLRLVTLDGRGLPIPLDAGRNLWQVRVEANLDRGATGTAALGWHPQRAEVISATASDARSGRHVPWRPDFGGVGAGGVRTLVDQPGRSDDEIAALAQAALDVRVASALSVHGIAEGDAKLWPGKRIALGGVWAEAVGVYVLTEVVHTVDAGGFLTEFDTLPPPAVVVPGGTGATATLGSVTSVDDPDGLGRARISLPALGDLDAGWLGVVCPGAGAGRGIVAMPDTGDTVLVLLPHGEPTAGLVIGSLYGTIAPPDVGIDGGHIRRWSMRTAAGQSIVIDDTGKSLRLGNDAGSFVELTPDLFTLHAATAMLIEAPGKALTVRASTIDFNHAPDAE